MQREMFEIAELDGRYPAEAFEFVLEALRHAQAMFDKKGPPGGKVEDEHHVTGRELLEGLCDLARQEFGLMAPTVFERWNVRRTDDIGEIVYRLIDAGILSTHEGDRREDFHNVFDLEKVLVEGYRILDGIDLGW
jgi:uncharacterized repeat protein (TIGR04138 family)